MAIKKSELYSSLWKSCDELRGGMDASQYKDYVLVLLFIKYISDKYAGVPYAPITVPEGSSFKDMVALKGKTTIGEEINTKIIAPITKANKLSASEMPDFDNAEKLGSGQDKVKKLTNLIAIFENPALDFSKNRAEGDDILGDAYEYLMRHFATESGKSKGQFYTPAEVSRVMAKVIGVKSVNITPETTVYDPTCGSGSLLLKVADEVDTSISIYGQEMDNATAALARINMILHNNPTAIIERENTLSTPRFLDDQQRLKMFDFAVANPPFSFKSWSNGVDTVRDSYGRFKDYGIPPAKNGDYAFLLHLIRSLKSKGKGAIILPHGVLFRGNVEAEIRTNIIRRGYIKGIIGLPANLFYGTGIPACIIVIDKENAHNRKGIFMIDASKGFDKDGNKNRLREQDIHKIVDVFNRQEPIEKYSRMVSVADIEEKHQFNLNIPRYIDTQEEEDIQDIDAHLLGDIPNADVDALEQFWEVYPSLRKVLFAAGNRPKYSKLLIANDTVKSTIFSHPEFVGYSKKVNEVFAAWRSKNTPKLKAIAVDDRPKQLIFEISEDLLSAFSNLKLIDRYDLFQHLMSYWYETMQDDVYSLVVDGWKAGNEIEKEKKEWEGRLIPKALMIVRYFAEEQEAIEKLEADRDALTQQMEEMVEEHGGEDGLMEEAKNDKDKITKVSVQKRLKEIKNDVSAADEQKQLELYLDWVSREAVAKTRVKNAQAALEKKLLDKYKILTEDEIKTLVVDDKWMAILEGDVRTEMDRISQRLTGRIKELAERYETSLPKMVSGIEKLAGKVDCHLAKMGFKW
jgi:type I restriction enzyme M protein